MNYQQTIQYLYESAPMFQRVGAEAYKPGLRTSLLLDERLGYPHRRYRTIHIAGTNGKGSCAHTIAAVLQAAGYRTGLFTSPHLTDFRERIKVNGRMIPKDYVVGFVARHRSFFEPLHPSFFELTTALAFDWFASAGVDVAVIETGMGGRLDCTNIITPVLCLITNISLDHTQFLGDTPAKIAREKAGIIKPGVPVVIGRAKDEVRNVFTQQAEKTRSRIVFACDHTNSYMYNKLPYTELDHRIPACPSSCRNVLESLVGKRQEVWKITCADLPGPLYYELSGLCQQENSLTILTVLRMLIGLGFHIDYTHMLNGFAAVCELTGLMGRWQRLQNSPLLICDTAHNPDGIAWIRAQLDAMEERRDLHIVLGICADKDVRAILSLLPPYASYYFTCATSKRAIPPQELKTLASAYGLCGKAFSTVPLAVEEAEKDCSQQGMVFVGGSGFVVADLLQARSAGGDALNFHQGTLG